MKGKGWTFAKDLRVGDELETAEGQSLPIEAIELKQETTMVYKMTVDEFHTYFVSDFGVWVHNTSKRGPCGVSFKGGLNLVDPKTIRFSQDSISKTFGKTTEHAGESIDDLIKGLKNGSIDSNDIPAIRIFKKNGKTYTLDNRRLYAFQQAGIDIKTVQATAEEVLNEAWKFKPINDGLIIKVRGK